MLLSPSLTLTLTLILTLTLALACPTKHAGPICERDWMVLEALLCEL